MPFTNAKIHLAFLLWLYLLQTFLLHLKQSICLTGQSNSAKLPDLFQDRLAISFYIFCKLTLNLLCLAAYHTFVFNPSEATVFS